MTTRASPVAAVPLDDEVNERLAGTPLPAVWMNATTGPAVCLAALGSGRTVLYVYPLTGRPDTDLPEGWETIPGARGCTAEACGFRDHHEELRQAGAARVYGLSAQPVDYQRELADRLRLPFAILSDPTLILRDALTLPTFDAGGAVRYRRLTMVIADGVIEHVFHPIMAPDGHAGEVLDWLLSRPGRDR
jgi:peroxiredoxin